MTPEKQKGRIDIIRVRSRFKGRFQLAILSRVKISPQQRYDLEDLFADQAAARADEKLWIQKFLSESNAIMGGFNVSGVGLNSATVAMTGCSLIIPQSTTDFSYFVSAPVEPDVVIPDADLVDGARNYLEVALATQDGTPLTKAFWDPEANSGNGAEFNQIVNTVTDLRVTFVVSTGGFSGLPDRLPIAILDVNGSGVIKVILDRRDLYGRLAKPNNLDNEYAWGTKVDPVYSLNMTGVAGTFTAGEVLTIGGETAKCVAGGTTAITFNEPTGINFTNGSAVTGASSGATGTVNTISESFTGVDKSLKGQKMINDALMTEFKNIKGTRFWWQDGPTLAGLKTEFQSLIAPMTSTARIKWTGSALIITDDNLAPADADVLASIRILNSTANLLMTRQDDGKEVVTITLSDVPTAGTLTLNQNGNLIAIPRTANTAAIQAAWNSSGAYAATISGSPADAKIVITANAAGAQVDVTTQSNTLAKAGTPVTPTYSIKQGMAADGSLAIADGQFLYVDLPDPIAGRTYDGAGSGATNFKVAARGAAAITDQSFWLAYREGTKLIFRGAGELQSGESAQISDNVPQGLLDAIGLTSETASPSYTSNIRGSQNESIIKRESVLTDAVGDQQEDRSGYLRSSDVVTWTGTQLEFTQDLVLELINTKSGTSTVHTVALASSPIVLADGESVYVLIDRTAASEALTLVNSGVTPIPAQTQANKDIFVLFKRIDAGGAGYVHIPFHKQVLEPGQTVRLGASGSGSGAGDGLAGDYKRRLVLSPFDYVTPNIFETDKATKVAGASTGSYSPAKKAFLMNIGQTLVSTQNLDADFLSKGADVGALELYLNWLEGFVDTAATYEISRDGGVNYQAITMSRVGLTETYRGFLNIVTEGANNNLEGYSVANADTNLTLNASTTQRRAGSFVVSATEVAKTVEVYLNKLGSPTGNYKVQIIKDSAGQPSTSVSDIVSESDLLPISGLSAGNNTVIVDISDVAMIAGTYWLVFSTDATYQASFSGGVTELRVRADTSAPTGGAASSFNGTIWATTASTSICLQLKGRVEDLRVRVTAGTNGVYLRGYGLFYGIIPGVTTQSTRKLDKFFFTGAENRTTFNLSFAPDPNLLVVYDAYRGQSYVADSDVFRIDGTSVIFVADFFNFPGENILIQFRQVDGSAQDTSDANATLIAANTNRLDDADLLETNYAQNAQGRFFQRQVPGTLTTKSDAAYGPDRWKLLTSTTTNVQSARSTDAPTSSPSRYSINVRQADATARQVGMVQYLETDRVWELRGRRVTLGFWVKATAANIPNMRASIIEWSGTADTMTSDPVSAYAATPTLVAGFTHVSTPADLAMTGQWVYFEVSATLSSSFNNLAIMIWTPATCAQNSDFFVTQVQLVAGSKARQFTRIALPRDRDLYECQRFFEKSYDDDVAPGTAAGNFSGAVGAGTPSVTGGGDRVNGPRFVAPKRATPTVVNYNPSTAGSAAIYEVNTGSNKATSGFSGPGITGVAQINAAGNSLVLNNSYIFHFTAEAEL